MSEWPHFDAEFDPVPRTAVGLIVLATDRVSHDDARSFLPDDVALYSSRLPMDVRVTPETLAAMKDHMIDAARNLVPGAKLDAIGYSCTSGTVAVGLENVHSRIAQVWPNTPIVTPPEAAVDALHALGARRIALLVPYLEPSADLVFDFVRARGFDIRARGTFGLNGDPEMNRLSAETIIRAGKQLVADSDGVDALFISCTGLRTASLIETLEQHVGVPVVTSNQAQAWQLLRVAGRTDRYPGFGTLLATM